MYTEPHHIDMVCVGEQYEIRVGTENWFLFLENWRLINNCSVLIPVLLEWNQRVVGESGSSS